MAKVVRSEGVSGKDLVPHLNSHESLLTFLAEECNIRLLPFAAIKLQYKLTRPFAGSITPDVLVELVSTCGGASIAFVRVRCPCLTLARGACHHLSPFSRTLFDANHGSLRGN